MLNRPLFWLVVLVLVSAVVTMAQQSDSATRRIPQFENGHVKVWKSIILPNQPLSMHRHEHSRALIALTDGNLDIVQNSGERETVHWEAGQAYWLTHDEPGTLHADVNNSDQPIEVIVVELKNDR
ncbi:MAG: hypothetical protein CL489_04760 [Acidobacteria bacterium]|jgi:quercetin dioxygenase-like cupin family protein|nr:hypothetical protein [Acidobacteriota bacterium]MBF83770.1 hypothetical protein [Acidobacteriota bacterium]MCH2278207.1 hypothetical protein [Vicinamibacterales bacterium]